MLKKTTLLLLMLLVLASTNTLFAQAKEACKPSECGPTDTKKGEAKAITALRTDLTNVIEQLSKVDGSYKEKLSSVKLTPGDTDAESLVVIYGASLEISKILVASVNAERLIPALRDTPDQPKTIQEMMASARQQVQLLSKQVGRL